MSDPEMSPREKARAASEAVTPILRDGLRTVLTTPVERLNLPWKAAEFEVDPMFYGIVAIPLDESLIPCIIPELVPFEVIEDEAVADVFGEVVMEWMADTWQELGGDKFPYPGQGFFHGYPERFDFNSRKWLTE
jgi:hypothetical protein